MKLFSLSKPTNKITMYIYAKILHRVLFTISLIYAVIFAVSHTIRVFRFFYINCTYAKRHLMFLSIV